VQERQEVISGFTRQNTVLSRSGLGYERGWVRLEAGREALC